MISNIQTIQSITYKNQLCLKIVKPVHTYIKAIDWISKNNFFITIYDYQAPIHNYQGTLGPERYMQTYPNRCLYFWWCFLCILWLNQRLYRPILKIQCNFLFRSGKIKKPWILFQRSYCCNNAWLWPLETLWDQNMLYCWLIPEFWSHTNL